MYTRGISPILATILLIGFTIAMAGVVSNVLIKQAKKFNPEEQQKESQYCDQANVAIGLPENLAQVTTTSQNIDGVSCSIINGILYKNKGAFTIHKLTTVAQIGKTKSSEDVLLSGPIAPQQTISGAIGYCQDPEITLYPWIQDPETDEIKPCPSRTLTINALEVQQP